MTRFHTEGGGPWKSPPPQKTLSNIQTLKICIVSYSCMTLWECPTNFFPLAPPKNLVWNPEWYQSSTVTWVYWSQSVGLSPVQTFCNRRSRCPHLSVGHSWTGVCEDLCKIRVSTIYLSETFCKNWSNRLQKVILSLHFFARLDRGMFFLCKIRQRGENNFFFSPIAGLFGHWVSVSTVRLLLLPVKTSILTWYGVGVQWCGVCGDGVLM